MSTGFTTYSTSDIEKAKAKGSGRQKVMLEPFEAHHLDQVFRLYGDVFGSRWAEDFARRWKWSQEKNMFPQESYKWVLVAADEVVGFLATTPLMYQVAKKEVLAHTPCDYMVHPKYRFHGIKLMQEFFRTCENCITCDDIPATIKVTQWMGARSIGFMHKYVKFLDARALSPSGPFSRLPSAAFSVGTMALRFADRVRILRANRKGPLWDTIAFDHRFEHFFNRLTEEVPAAPTRKLGFLQWRYGDISPQAHRQIAIMTDVSGELSGYVVYLTSQKDKRVGYILDIQSLPPGDEDISVALLWNAVMRMREQGAWKVRFRLLPSPFNPPESALRKVGFMRRGHYQFMVRSKDPDLLKAIEDIKNWNYSFGDSEASHSYS